MTPDLGHGFGRMFEVRDKPEMVERALLIRIYADKREEDDHLTLSVLTWRAPTR